MYDRGTSTRRDRALSGPKEGASNGPDRPEGLSLLSSTLVHCRGGDPPCQGSGGVPRNQQGRRRGCLDPRASGSEDPDLRNWQPRAGTRNRDQEHDEGRPVEHGRAHLRGAGSRRDAPDVRIGGTVGMVRPGIRRGLRGLRDLRRLDRSVALRRYRGSLVGDRSSTLVAESRSEPSGRRRGSLDPRAFGTAGMRNEERGHDVQPRDWHA